MRAGEQESVPRSFLRRIGVIVAGPLGLAAGFAVVHLVLALINLYDDVHFPFGDVVQVYRFWMEYAEQNGVLVGIDTSWVYPVGALAPMGLAYLAGPDHYGQLWLLMVTALDAAAMVVLARARLSVAWWWLAFLAALGPIAVARIDAVTAPLAILAAVWLLRRPAVAAALLTFAAWIKVWPVALIGAAVLALRSRFAIGITALATTALVLITALVLGARGGLFSFITEQTGRGLQVEAPVSAWWLWSAALGVPGYRVYYDTDILTYQVAGPGTSAVAAGMTPLLVLAVAAVAAAGLVALRRGVDPIRVVVELSLALTLTLIVVNKVGSPQFMGWLAAPAVLGMLNGWTAFRGRTLALLVIALATQLVYPWWYSGITTAQLLPVLLLTARNVAVVVLLGVTVARLVRLSAVPRAVAVPVAA